MWFVILVSIAAVWSVITALPDCQQAFIPLYTGQTVTYNSPNYPNGFLAGSACKTKLAAPIYNNLAISCYYYVGVKGKFQIHAPKLLRLGDLIATFLDVRFHQATVIKKIVYMFWRMVLQTLRLGKDTVALGRTLIFNRHIMVQLLVSIQQNIRDFSRVILRQMH